ncbi:hypothetical protein COY28_05785 [Candidatus Woesearchaeota archaeon CG_4_10_14_0_2_um_filter_57_5]|nr:MAG: hypothetical protein COY28_05785 [Candidatus Woesearchaeota archaeon CG_4_10_14_0_2_um_filter_57_5]
MILASTALGILRMDDQGKVQETIPLDPEELQAICRGEYIQKELDLAATGEAAHASTTGKQKVYMLTPKETKHENITLTSDPRKISFLTAALQERAQQLREENIQLSAQAVKASVTFDTEAMKAVHALDELERQLNAQLKRLGDWLSLYYPEQSEKHKGSLILTKLAHDAPEQEMGAGIHPREQKALQALAAQAEALEQSRLDLEAYLAESLKANAPNLAAIAGPTMAARLIALAGGMEHLARLPASTVQMLGAEKALFRHLRTGARPPKHGIIVNHPYIQEAPPREHGRRARALADTISMAARVDFYKGADIVEQLQQRLARRKR